MEILFEPIRDYHQIIETFKTSKIPTELIIERIATKFEERFKFKDKKIILWYDNSFVGAIGLAVSRLLREKNQIHIQSISRGASNDPDYDFQFELYGSDYGELSFSPDAEICACETNPFETYQLDEAEPFFETELSDGYDDINIIRSWASKFSTHISIVNIQKDSEILVSIGAHDLKTITSERYSDAKKHVFIEYTQQVQSPKEPIYVTQVGPLKDRINETSKGDYGKVMVITGSEGMSGAGILTASAALTAGAGLVYLAVPKKLSNIYEVCLRESITIGFGNEAYLSYENVDEIIEKADTMNLVIIGPGMGTNPSTIQAVHEIIQRVEVPLVIDADAINAVATNPYVLNKCFEPPTLTPHPGEMGRLIEKSPKEVNRDRLNVAASFAKKYECNLILKGFHSIIATYDGRTYVNSTGNPGMSTAGAGDVLSGILGALSLVDPSENALIQSVFYHGLAGDYSARDLGQHSLRAQDIIDHLHLALRSGGRLN
jgi:hydroxyethylthiazole kinase-like uncharacterized protein yjeF